MIFIRRSISK